MTAKEYLNQAYWLDRRIESKLEQLSALKEMATRTPVAMTSDVVNRTQNMSRMQEVINKIIDMQNEINEDIDRLVDLKRDIMHIIKAENNTEYQTLLELRYLCFKSWDSIAKQMGYSIRHIYRLHDEAVEQMEIPETCH